MLSISLFLPMSLIKIGLFIYNIPSAFCRSTKILSYMSLSYTFFYSSVRDWRILEDISYRASIR